MYRDGNVLVEGQVKVVPINAVEIPDWMQELSGPVSTVFLGENLPKEALTEPVGPSGVNCWKQLVTKDGEFIGVVGKIPDWRKNSVRWRRWIHSSYDPNDTILAKLTRIQKKVEDVAYLCVERVDGYGETHYSFHKITK